MLTFRFYLVRVLGWPIYATIPAAIILASLLGWLIEFTIYRPLRKKKSSSIILLLASLGIYIVLQNLISLFFGDDHKIHPHLGSEGGDKYCWGLYNARSDNNNCL